MESRYADLEAPDLSRPIAAPLAQCAELLGVDLASVCELAAKVESYLRADGTKVWSPMQLERQLHPEAFVRQRGGYIEHRAARPPGHRRTAIETVEGAILSKPDGKLLALLVVWP